MCAYRTQLKALLHRVQGRLLLAVNMDTPSTSRRVLKLSEDKEDEARPTTAQKGCNPLQSVRQCIATRSIKDEQQYKIQFHFYNSFTILWFYIVQRTKCCNSVRIKRAGVYRYQEYIMDLSKKDSCAQSPPPLVRGWGLGTRLSENCFISYFSPIRQPLPLTPVCFNIVTEKIH